MTELDDEAALTFSQVFYEDKAIEFVFTSLREATRKWSASSLFNETVLLNEVANALANIGEDKCPSPNYPHIHVSAKRTILDKAAKDNSDMFGADLGLTLSMFENDELIKQRTALFQLKLGDKVGPKTQYKLDVRQVYNSGHNKHSLGRWFMAVCEKTHAIWSFGTARQIGSRLQEAQLKKVEYAASADRIVQLEVGSDWLPISQWIGNWLAGEIGRDSDLSDSNRIEIIIENLQRAEAARNAGQDLTDEFDRQFAASAPFLPRIYLDVQIKSAKKKRHG